MNIRNFVLVLLFLSIHLPHDQSCRLSNALSRSCTGLYEQYRDIEMLVYVLNGSIFISGCLR